MSEQQMLPPEGKALVYIIRSAKFGYKTEFKVFRDGLLLGRTKGLIFIPEILDPGTYSYACDKTNEIFLSVEAGKTYFLQQKVQPSGLSGRSSFKILDESLGREELTKCKLGKFI